MCGIVRTLGFVFDEVSGTCQHRTEGSPPGSSSNPQNTKRWVLSSTFAQMRSLRLRVALAVTVTPVAEAGTPWESSG